MNKQTTVDALLKNFRQQGVTRKRASFFGKPIGASPADKMVRTFAASGLTRSEPNFFGITFREAGARSRKEASKAQLNQILLMPKRRQIELLRAA